MEKKKRITLPAYSERSPSPRQQQLAAERDAARALQKRNEKAVQARKLGTKQAKKDEPLAKAKRAVKAVKKVVTGKAGEEKKKLTKKYGKSAGKVAEATAKVRAQRKKIADRSNSSEKSLKKDYNAEGKRYNKVRDRTRSYSWANQEQARKTADNKAINGVERLEKLKAAEAKIKKQAKAKKAATKKRK